MTYVKKIVLTSLFISLTLIMPFFTAQIPTIGSMLLPMHIPVLLAGFVCGGKVGLIVGFVSPLLRSAFFTMPPMFPTATAMAFELAAYGFITGYLYHKLNKSTMSIYTSLIGSMIIGRFVWGIVMFACLGINGGTFTFEAFIAGAFINAAIGIVVQLFLIPTCVILLQKNGLIHVEK